ncbi:MAG: putative lipoprotein [Parcubacteria bacterium C7867-001]|nr:MAG: putative lipoprotein [Parcubacteria bacterium C7867-001]
MTLSKDSNSEHSGTRKRLIGGALIVSGLILAFWFGGIPSKYDRAEAEGKKPLEKLVDAILPEPKLDTADYDKRMLALAHVVPATTTSTSTATTTKKSLWPAKTVYPNAGALLPFNRILAYYGNFYSKGMGVLGEYPEDVMIAKLLAEKKNWEAADPSTPVIPAIHYIVVTAQGSAGKDGKYRLRMPDDQIDKALAVAEKVHGVVFIDFQVALSNLQTELPIYEEYLKKPNVHLGVDPEFAMQPSGKKPGTVIGTMDATDINFAASYLAKLVQDNKLPPKVLVIHRFTKGMVTNYQAIKPLPEVQIVIDMDGWGFGAKKINTYNTVITPEPVQFAGFKLFYKNDLKAPSTRLLTPAEVLKLTPAPIYIQYQ